jgi:Lar family restriction alleviation protein
MMESTYTVTFTVDHPEGDRYPLKIEIEARGVEQAVNLAVAKAEASHFQKEKLVLMSAMPELCPPAFEGLNRDGLLKPCPFCGNPHVSLLETFRELDDESTWFVNCGCCNASQLPDSKEGAIRNWNQRDGEVK